MIFPKFPKSNDVVPSIVPSGNLTVGYWKWMNMALFFLVDLPIEHGDFPIRYVNVYQAG